MNSTCATVLYSSLRLRIAKVYLLQQQGKLVILQAPARSTGVGVDAELLHVGKGGEKLHNRRQWTQKHSSSEWASLRVHTAACCTPAVATSGMKVAASPGA